MRSARLRLLGAAVAPMILLAACGSDSDPAAPDDAAVTAGADDAAGTDGAAATGAPDDSAATSIAPTGDVEDLAVQMREQDGLEVPVLTLDGEPLSGEDGGPAEGLPFAVAQTQVQEVAAGEGEEVTEGQHVTLRYLAVNGTTGQEVISTFPTQEEVQMDLSDPGLLPGFLEALPGHAPGAQLIMAIPAAEGFGPTGQPELGVGPADTLLFYTELVSAHTPLTQAEGTAVEPPEGLPTIEADGTAPATVTIPEGEEPPTELVVQPLIEGEGEPVEAGQTVTVHYTGVQWSDGSQFDSSLEGGEPFDFALGDGQVIQGWDEGLVGQPVGSRVLLIVPPELGYGAADGNPLQEETLVFVVDILDAH